LNSDWLLLGTGTMIKKSEPRDLFTDLKENQSIPQVKEPVKTEPEDLSSAASNISEERVMEKEILPCRKVEKVLIFYSDKTFEEYMPGNI
jgi:hypothetical protein